MNKKVFWFVAGVLGSASAFADPSNLGVTSISTSLNLTWLDSIPPLPTGTEYEVWIDTSSYAHFSPNGGSCPSCTASIPPLPPSVPDCSTHTAWIRTNTSRWSAPVSFFHGGTPVTPVTTGYYPPSAPPSAPPIPFTGPSAYYEWTGVANASWYQIWVGNESTGTKEFSTWQQASNLSCVGGGVCHFTPTTPATTLPLGDRYVWWVRPWNCMGAGSWNSPGVPFNI